MPFFRPSCSSSFQHRVLQQATLSYFQLVLHSHLKCFPIFLFFVRLPMISFFPSLSQISKTKVPPRSNCFFLSVNQLWTLAFSPSRLSHLPFSLYTPHSHISIANSRVKSFEDLLFPSAFSASFSSCCLDPSSFVSAPLPFLRSPFEA